MGKAFLLWAALSLYLRAFALLRLSAALCVGSAVRWLRPAPLRVVYIYRDRHANACMHMRVCTCIHVYRRVVRLGVYMHTQTHKHTHTHIRVRMVS